MESEKPLPLIAFIGCVLTVMSLFITYALGKTVFEEGRQSLASLSGLAVLILGIVLVYTGVRKTE